MPAGPAPTIITSYFKDLLSPWNPDYHTTSNIYLLVNLSFEIQGANIREFFFQTHPKVGASITPDSDEIYF